MKRLIILLIPCLLFVIFSGLFAADTTKTAEPQNMGPMGPPAELKKLAILIGDWTTVDKTYTTPGAPPMETQSSGEFAYMLDGCAIQQKFVGDFEGMHYEGYGLIAFNRSTGKWQMSWMDNMSAQISLYDGDFKEGKLIFAGEDFYNNQKTVTRVTFANMTDKHIDWSLESSFDGGKTFTTFMTSVFTKKLAK